MCRKTFTAIILSLIICMFLLTDTALGLQAPSKSDIENYRRDGTMTERIKNALEIGNNKTDELLMWKMHEHIKQLFLESQGASNSELEKLAQENAPPLIRQFGLPSKGTVKVIVLLVDFPDYPHDPLLQSKENFNQNFFGNGDSQLYPYDSLKNFYKRSSYNQLNITGNVLGWYRAKNSRSYYSSLGPQKCRETIIKEALAYYDKRGHDFSQYDNDNDGYIDTLYLKWTGPDEGWASNWWALTTVFWDDSFTVDGKSLWKYVWSWYSDFEDIYFPYTDIHETGHALGLPDYYDYDPDVGPDGGIGGLDIMGGYWGGDHNCFSKFLLDWINPTIISSGTQTKSLNPSGTSQDAVLIMPGATNNSFGEFFMAQYRKRSTGNDPYYYPADGLLIWHVDSMLDTDEFDFKYDNSTTEHKLLALEQADGRGDIEKVDNTKADAGDFYLPPKTFTPFTNPNSNKYNYSLSNVYIDNLSTPGNTIAARMSINPADKTPPTYQSAAASNSNRTVTLTFSEELVANIANLKNAITYSTNGTTFAALGAGDNVAISGNTLVVTFNGTLTGSSVKIRVAANSLKDAANNVLNSIVTTEAISLDITRGDMNGDGKLNILDLLWMASKIGPANTEEAIRADLHKDGKVNILDLLDEKNYLTTTMSINK